MKQGKSMRSFFIGYVLLVSVAMVACMGCNDSAKTSGQVLPADSTMQSVNGNPLEQAKALQERGDIQGAIQAYDRLLLQDPINIAALGNRANLLQGEGDFKAALRDYNVLLEVDPSNVAALMRRADLQVKLGQLAAALRDYDLMLSHRPDDATLLNSRGEVHLQLGQAAKAAQDFQAALKLRPGWDAAVLNRAAVWYALGDFEQARTDYQAILAAQPGNSEATNGLGLITQFVDGDLAAAEELYRKAIFQDARNAGAWYNLAFLEAGKGQSLKAIDDFGEAIRLDATYADARLNRGLLHMQVKLVGDAVADFEAAVELRPDNAHAHLLLGWARCEGGSRIQGCLSLSKAKELGDKDADNLIRQYCK
ncbi:MAG TPA: tetratricopeptide repeat protein [Bacteroidia bacterium]|nr:tetratricopeptide repeat protein [Bacteroidia bacterium]